MPTYRKGLGAFGAPGAEPLWTHGDKDGVGTAYSGSSRLWFTIWNGIVTELYHPVIDRPQIRDLQFLISDGETFLHRETEDLDTSIRRIDQALAYNVHAEDRKGRYSFDKTILADPHQPCLLIHTRLRASKPTTLEQLKLYVLCAPHLECGGADNSGFILELMGDQRVLVARKEDMWMAIAATHPFSRASAGYAGSSDGHTDLADGYKMKWEFDRAENGNIALMGEIPLCETSEFTLGLAFGDSLQRAVTTLFQSLATPFEQHRKKYAEQWGRATNALLDLTPQSGDDGHLYGASCQLLLAHEDKLAQGAMIASLAIPWGNVRGDKEGAGGYHLVWPRDIVQSALALLCIGNKETPLRSLIYLAMAQQPDGGFAQNFWIDGTPFWKGAQLDEAAFPLLLAYRLWKEDALEGFDPLPMVMSAAGYLVRQGPVTGQDRWEENSGYSPSTLASCIAALVAAAAYIRFREEGNTALFIEDYADYLESHIEEWTVTDESDLVAGVSSHYVRMHPIEHGQAARPGDLLSATIKLTSKAPTEQTDFPARTVVDAGFLQLVRYGVRAPDDDLIVRSVRVIDALLKVDTPSGVCWRRYNHDGYGQRADGSPYDKYGVGRAWPLLAGERGHYEVAAGRSADKQIRSMEGFATPTHLLPEQVWDEPDLPEAHLRCGRPTGSATPLLWAHAEYIRLLRSKSDGKVYDVVPEVVERYLGKDAKRGAWIVWSFQHPSSVRRPGEKIRLIAEAAFSANWSRNGWQTTDTLRSMETKLGFHFVDLEDMSDRDARIDFKFYWIDADRWEGKSFVIETTPTR